jgi:hypothetical protein
MDITDEEFEAANRRGAEVLAKYPAAVAVHYDHAGERLVIALSTRQQVEVELKNIRGMEQARPEDLVDAQISPRGLGIHFPRIDADISIPALLNASGFFNKANR